MALLIAGVDEAGYGPLLGPLCVGLTVFRVENWREGDAAPDLWSTLSRSVARTVKSAGGKIVIADSKELKLPNSGTKRHPLTHLERGVLTVLSSMGRGVADDAELLGALDAAWPAHEIYGGDATTLPISWTSGQIAIAANPFKDDLQARGVEPVSMCCRVVGEVEFNDLVRRGGGKGATTIAAVGEHFRRVMDLAAATPDDGVRFVCDRLGGRIQYADVVAGFAGVSIDDVRIVEETDERSRYFVRIGERQVGVVFLTESEKYHLPIALASMTAKLVRELSMIRFNRHWAARVPDLAPTAGYWQDAKRWLKAVGERMSAAERRTLVRIA